MDRKLTSLKVITAIFFLLLIFMVSCSKLNTPSIKTYSSNSLILQSEGNEPSTEEISNIWNMDDKYLIERSWQSNRVYSLIVGEENKAICPGLSAEYIGNMQDDLLFKAHGQGNDGTIFFPYLVTYGLKTGLYHINNYFVKPNETTYWGQYGAGRILKELIIAEKSITMVFGIRDEYLGKYTHFPRYSPFTRASFDSVNNELVICLYQTEVSDRVAQTAKQFSQNQLFRKVSLEQKPYGQPFNEQYWWFHGHTFLDVKNYPSVVLRIRPQSVLSFTSPDIPSSLTTDSFRPNSQINFRLEFSN